MAIAYAVVGTVLTHLVGRPLSSLNFRQQRVEADFRYALVRVRENMEGIALYRGEGEEKATLLHRFGAVIGNWYAIMTRMKMLNTLVVGYQQVAGIFPVVVAAPRYFAGTIQLPERFPCSLPIVVDHLNNRWSSVLYDRKARKMRPLGMSGGKAYCHLPPTEKESDLYIGHPFTLDRDSLWLSVVQTGEKEVTLQIQNPADKPVTTTVHRSPYFDFVQSADFKITVPAGSCVERQLR